MGVTMDLILSPDADNDLDFIRAHTLKLWGARQQTKYAALLEKGLLALMDKPLLGKARNDLREGMRMHRVGKHCILYMIDGRTIRVGRILHEKMDAGRHV